MNQPQISIVIPCRNEGIHIIDTVSSILINPTNLTFEIIVVDDGSTDGCCRFLTQEPYPKKVTLVNGGGVGACRARNLGASQSQADYLVFCDAHILVQPFWLDRLFACFSPPDIGIVSPGIASPHLPDAAGYGLTLTENFGVEWLGSPGKVSPVLIAPGGCMLVNRHTFLNLGGFDQSFKVWGHEDVELSLKYWLFGYQVLVNPVVKILHVFREKHPYTVTMNQVYYNYLRMALSHFNPQRVKKIIGLVKTHPLAEEIITDTIFSDVWEQRERYFSSRVRDDDWLFQKFSVPF